MWLNRHFNRFAAILLAGILMTVIGCDVRPTTMGYQYRIFIVADSLLWEDVKDDVLATFEKLIYTPHTETSFEVHRISLEKLAAYKTRMNIFLLGVADGHNETDDYIRKILPDDFKKSVAEGKMFYAFQDNLYARDQINLIMYAQNVQDFKRNFKLTKDDIYKTFEKKYYKRLLTGMYERGEQTNLSDFLAKNYGFRVRVQHDYFIAVQDVDDHFVWLRRTQPDRWLSVWRVKGDSSLINDRSLYDIRDRMTKKYYEGDKVIREDSYLTDVEFNGRPTTKIIGLWKNDSLLVGGPFRTYIIPEPKNSLIWFVDIAVMAPGRLKKPYLDQLEVMAHTFKIVQPQK
ncbi:MAG TPA: DUF4837 family protein [Caldithrix abyssi]|uniref:DUF4837 family protein n=1 Tax=Caldithrix abyssi TaxID=187145 RepID=A0A7V4U1Z0_CALAY|nr:DUF4837 family protein [Caldithrix abyssi]